MNHLSVAIVACNEAENIRRALESVKWADEIVIVDSGSTDGTLEIASEYGAKMFRENWEGYGRQVNRAIDRCTCPWVLNIDADEQVSPALAAEIRAAIQDPEFAAYWVPRLNLIFGRWMRHGGLYPDYKLRLFRRGSARLEEDTEPHATPKTALATGKLTGDLLHYQYPTLDVYFEHMNRYSSATVPLLVRRRKRSRSLFAFVANTILNPAAAFVYNYVLRRGFLDGREGLLFHLYHSLYVNWKYAKAWRLDPKPAGVLSHTPPLSKPFWD